jgi:hypothetical protein
LRAGRDTHFEPACSLAGHENWVRSLAFCHATAGSGGAGAAPSQLLLASACQDRYARVWSIVHDENSEAAAPSTAAAAAADTATTAANNAAGASIATASGGEAAAGRRRASYGSRAMRCGGYGPHAARRLPTGGVRWRCDRDRPGRTCMGQVLRRNWVLPAPVTWRNAMAPTACPPHAGVAAGAGGKP